MEKRKWIVRAVCILLTVLMAASVLGPLAYTAYADEETPKEKLDRIQQELQDLEDKIEDTKDDISKQQELKQYYQQQSNTLKAQIEALSAQISETEATLQAKQEELGNKILEVEQSKADFEDRLVAMYEMSRQSNLSILLGIDDFSEMLRFSENLQSIAVSDTQIMENLRAQEQTLEQQAAQEQQQMDQLNASQEELKRLEAEYAQALQQADSQMTQAQAEKESYEKASAEKEKEIEEAERRYAEWAAQDDNPGVDFTGGTFVWPLPGYTQNSPMGWRTDPITGQQSFHRGTDIPAPKGTRIYAAAGGVVSTHADSSYGTCVKISHGGGLVTIYAHMSARADGIGDGVVVEQGQLIGCVGSTGRSIGNHLHFEANLNGTPVSVFDYL